MSVKNSKAEGSIRKTIYDFLCGRLENKQVLYFVIYFTVISVLELLAYTSGNKGITSLASKIWFTGGVVSLITFLYYFVLAVRKDISQKNIICLVGLALGLFYLLYLCGNVKLTDVSPDATQQAAAGLDSFRTTDLNYTGKAFLGYPNRQYVLIAIPAWIFGRSITTLQLGFAIPFILGIITLYSGLREWTYKKGMNGAYAIIAIYAIFAFRFISEYYINFEQSILPVSLTMMLIGLFLQLLCKPNVLCIMSIAWVGCLCSNSYTPSLATLGLLIVFVALVAITLTVSPGRLPIALENRRQLSIILFAVDTNILVFLLSTLLAQRSDRVNSVREDINILSYSCTSIYDFLTDKNAVFMGCMGVLVIIYLIASLALCLKPHDFLLSLWVLGVFVATNIMTGYTAYNVAWVMQRAMIVIPVLITGMLLTFCEFVLRYKIKMRSSFFVLIIITCALIGRYNFMQMNQSFTYFNYIQPMKYMLKDLEETTRDYGMSHTDTFNFVFYTKDVAMKNPADYFQFLYPKANIYLGIEGEFPQSIDLSLPTIIYGDSNIASMTPSNEVEYVRYQNKRYDTTGIWYKICLTP